MNLVVIANACAVECERQQVDLIELSWLIKAYDKMVRGYKLDSYDAIVNIGRCVEPHKNEWGFRITPATFQNGGGSCPSYLIHDKIDALIENIRLFKSVSGPTEQELARDKTLGEIHDAMAQTLTKEFLWIHPFQDGNGRVGFLLYNYLLGTLHDPKPLSKFDW